MDGACALRAATEKGVPVTSAEALLTRIREAVSEWPVEGLGGGTDIGSAYQGDVNQELDAWRAQIAKEIIALDEGSP